MNNLFTKDLFFALVSSLIIYFGLSKFFLPKRNIRKLITPDSRYFANRNTWGDSLNVTNIFVSRDRNYKAISFIGCFPIKPVIGDYLLLEDTKQKTIGRFVFSKIKNIDNPEDACSGMAQLLDILEREVAEQIYLEWKNKYDEEIRTRKRIVYFT